MKKYVKKTALFMVMAMVVLSMLSSCSIDKAKQSDSGSSGSSGSSTSEETNKNKSPMKLKLLGPSNPGSASKYVNFEEREKYPVWQELQKMLDAANLKLEFEIVPNEQYKVVIQTRMAAASNLPDIANISPLDDVTSLKLAQQKVILDLNSLIDKHSNGNIKRMYTKVYPFAPKLTTAPDGNMYWFSNLHIKSYKGTELAPVGLTMLIRKDWKDKLSLEVPTTTEEYFNLLKDMREKDANGNKQKDEILVYDPQGFGGSIAQWFGLGSGITAIDFETNKVISPWYQSGVKDYFIYLNKLVKAEILDTSLIAASGEKINQAVMENKVASINSYGMQTWFEPMVTAEKAEYYPLMPLNAVEGIEPASQMEPPNLVWEKHAITKGCKNPEAAIAFYDIIYSDEYSTLSTWGIEGLTFKVENGVKLLIEKLTAEEKAKTLKADGNVIYGKTVFPVVQMANLESELLTIPDFKKDYQINIMSHKRYFSNFNDNFLAIPNSEQLEDKTRILNDLTTYSGELATKLALGQASLDDWDTYMKELKELGLDRLIEIDQELHDRFNSIKVD